MNSKEIEKHYPNSIILRDSKKVNEPIYILEYEKFPQKKLDHILRVEIALRKCERLKVFQQ